MAPQSKPKATKEKAATTEVPQPSAVVDSQTPPPEENQVPPKADSDSNAASCILATSLATEYASYQPGDSYTATPETIQRLIDRGLAVPVTQ